MSFLDRIAEANVHDPGNFRPLVVTGTQVGRVSHAWAETLARWPEVFQVSDDQVWVAAELDSFEARTQAVAQVLEQMRGKGYIRGWRDELYPINRYFAEPAYLHVERAAIPIFGAPGYGVHMNGFVRSAAGLQLWVAKRALSKPTGPDKLDQLVAGGQPVGIGLKDNMVKESREEAGIPFKLADRAVPVGAISYCLETPLGLRPDVIFTFDLELPADFMPINLDGEVEEFQLWPMERVVETVRDTADFKFNCALVVIDFLVRHGVLPPDHPDYMQIVGGLRV